MTKFYVWSSSCDKIKIVMFYFKAAFFFKSVSNNKKKIQENICIINQHLWLKKCFKEWFQYFICCHIDKNISVVLKYANWLINTKGSNKNSKKWLPPPHFVLPCIKMNIILFWVLLICEDFSFYCDFENINKIFEQIEFIFIL